MFIQDGNKNTMNNQPVIRIVKITPEITKIIKDAILGEKDTKKVIEKTKSVIKKVEPGSLFNKSKAKLLKKKIIK